MKKRICIALAFLVLIGCLTGCNFTQNMSGALAGEAEATPKVEEMMEVLADQNTSKAKDLIHPQVSETSLESAIAQMSDYLAGRKASAIELKNINIHTSSGSSGKARQENLAYQVILTDGTVIWLNVVYLSNAQGTGFSSFQVVLGVV